MFEAAVVDDVLHAVVLLQKLQNVGAALAPSAGVVHGVQRHMAARVGGEPVVGEHRIGGVVPAVVIEQVHSHTSGLEHAGRAR